jgi:hypothetical protein
VFVTKEFFTIINFDSSASYSSVLETVGHDPSVVGGK